MLASSEIDNTLTCQKKNINKNCNRHNANIYACENGAINKSLYCNNTSIFGTRTPIQIWAQ